MKKLTQTLTFTIISLTFSFARAQAAPTEIYCQKIVDGQRHRLIAKVNALAATLSVRHTIDNQLKGAAALRQSCSLGSGPKVNFSRGGIGRRMLSIQGQSLSNCRNSQLTKISIYLMPTSANGVRGYLLKRVGFLTAFDGAISFNKPLKYLDFLTDAACRIR